MEQEIILKYFNERLNIAMSDWKIVYLLDRSPAQLFPEVERGRLVYRAKGSVKRISYATIKKGLVRKQVIIKEQLPEWIV